MQKNTHIPALHIGNLTVSPPIIQGGMGVRVSRASLAAAVANEGGVGIIASVGLGDFENQPGSKFVKVNEDALRSEIRKARTLSKGIIGVNIMVALSNFENLVTTSVEENVDLIISGAGLPLDLPKFLNGKDIKLIPIVSSGRALKIIYKKWKNTYNKVPDAVIVEGPEAGGHLGYSMDALTSKDAPNLEVITQEVLDTVKELGENIPVIPAGGIFDGKDIAKYLKMGAAGVQLATRFVCTDECDVSDAFKQAYLDCTAEDITLIKSPVGLPGRVIKSEFIDKVVKGEKVPFICSFHCLKTCDPKTAPFCIAKVLANAAEGHMEEGFVFAGSNAFKCNEIVPVKALMDELVKETEEALS